MRYFIIYIVVFITMLFCSCSRRPSYVIPEKKMMDVLLDIRLTQSIYMNDPQFKLDEMKDALVAGVLEKHKITQAELDSSLLWYSDNIQAYAEINDTVASRLRARNEMLMSARMSENTKGRQRLDLLIPTSYSLDKYTPTLAFNIDSFKIKATKNISAFNLKFDVQGLAEKQRAEAAVYFTYKDTLVRRSVPIEGNRHYVLSKPQLPDSLLKSISGYIHIKGSADIPNVLLYNMSYIDSLAQSSAPSTMQPTTIPAASQGSPESHSGSDVREKRDEVKESSESKQEEPVRPNDQKTPRAVLRGKRAPNH